MAEGMADEIKNEHVQNVQVSNEHFTHTKLPEITSQHTRNCLNREIHNLDDKSSFQSFLLLFFINILSKGNLYCILCFAIYTKAFKH